MAWVRTSTGRGGRSRSTSARSTGTARGQLHAARRIRRAAGLRDGHGRPGGHRRRDRGDARGACAEALAAGAWGMSTGLVYPPGAYAATDEIVEVGRELSAGRALYASHIRNEADDLLAAVDEALDIGTRLGVPVEISHLKAAGRANHGHVADATRAHRGRARTRSRRPLRRLSVRRREHLPQSAPAAVAPRRRRGCAGRAARVRSGSAPGSRTSSKRGCRAGRTCSRRPAAGTGSSSRVSTGPTVRLPRAAASRQSQPRPGRIR